MDGTSGATGLMQIADGRNDGVNRLYVPHFETGEIYEITHINPYKISTVRINTIETSKIEIHLYKATNTIKLKVEGINDDNAMVELVNVSGKIIFSQSFKVNDDILNALIRLPNTNIGFVILRVNGQTLRKISLAD